MKVIHVLRKPLSEGSVAANVLRHGTGALNIDASRVRMSDADKEFIIKTARPNTSGASHVGAVMNRPQNPTVNVHSAGRWPANLVLQHLPGCRPHAPGAGAGCACVPGCPVVGLDDQSGNLAPQGGQKHKDTKEGSFLNTGFGGSNSSTFYGDVGGASRFFKQVGGDDEGNDG